jgi:hypothetical protein
MAARRTARGWRAGHLATAVDSPEQEFRRSLDAFPLEYGEIIRAHSRVLGDNPFDGVEIASSDLRRGVRRRRSRVISSICARATLNLAAGPSAVTDLVIASIPGFTAPPTERCAAQRRQLQ